MRRRSGDFSKRIGQFGVDNDDNVEPEAAPTNVPLSARQMTLQRNVQAFAAAFLRDMVLSMPNLPQDGEYAELQSKHKAGLEHKINRERSAAAAAVLRVQWLTKSTFYVISNVNC